MKPPVASSAAASKRMKANRRRDTGPELALRSKLHRRGLRFRIDYPVLMRRRADIAFPKQRVAVMVDGCFWHGCPDHGSLAKSNANYWDAKIALNRARDIDTTERLTSDGWLVVRVWEHEDMDSASDRVSAVLAHRLQQAPDV